MINLEFTEEEKNSLYYERFHHPHPRVQLKMEVLWLKSQKIPHKKICQLAGISPNTLLTYLRDYEEGGIEKLKEINFYRPKSELESQKETLKKYFEKNPPATINEAVYRIEELTGIKRSPTQVRKFLKSLGMKCLKVGSLPSKADPDEQEDYKEKKLEPRLNEAKEGKRAVFFVDAAHFVMGAFLGFVWCFERLFVKSPSGRKRFNVLG
ncbi:helix-turn-helix domain-containing protein, partial [Microcystis aeruginosa]